MPDLLSSFDCVGSEQAAAGYTAVLVAVPLELTSIAFSGFDMPAMPRRAYQTTWTTLVVGVLRPGYFGVQSLPEGMCGRACNLSCVRGAQMVAQ